MTAVVMIMTMVEETVNPIASFIIDTEDSEAV